MTRGSIRNSWYVLFVSFSISVWKGVTSSCQIYFGESKAIYYPHGDLPLSGPTCPAQYNFAFPYQTSQTCPHLFHKMTSPSPPNKKTISYLGYLAIMKNVITCQGQANCPGPNLPLENPLLPTYFISHCWQFFTNLATNASGAKFAEHCKSPRAVLAVLEAKFATNSDLLEVLLF